MDILPRLRERVSKRRNETQREGYWMALHIDFPWDRETFESTDLVKAESEEEAKEKLRDAYGDLLGEKPDPEMFVLKRIKPKG